MLSRYHPGSHSDAGASVRGGLSFYIRTIPAYLVTVDETGVLNWDFYLPFGLRLRKDFPLVALSRLTPNPGSLSELLQRTRFHHRLYRLTLGKIMPQFGGKVNV